MFILTIYSLSNIIFFNFLECYNLKFFLFIKLLLDIKVEIYKNIRVDFLYFLTKKLNLKLSEKTYCIKFSTNKLLNKIYSFLDKNNINNDNTTYHLIIFENKDLNKNLDIGKNITNNDNILINKKCYLKNNHLNYNDISKMFFLFQYKNNKINNYLIRLINIIKKTKIKNKK